MTQLLSRHAARSYLFVPGDHPKRFQKAFSAGADAVILDLEDAVAPDNKSVARDAISNFSIPRHEVVIRVNAADTDWFESDLELCRQVGAAAVILPKAARVEEIAEVTRRLGDRIAILALVETAQGIANVAALATSGAVKRLIFGSIDFQLDMGIEGDAEELLLFRSQLVLASRCAGLPPPCDGVTTAINDSELVSKDALRARRLGFGAKLCIHPQQVPLVNDAFSPSTDECIWANRVLQAAANAHGAAVALDGKMIDRPVVARAQRIIDASRRERP